MFRAQATHWLKVLAKDEAPRISLEQGIMTTRLALAAHRASEQRKVGRAVSRLVNLGLIPARAGSKGVPGKNIRPVNGKPLLAHAVECGLACPELAKVVVSTDSQKFADIAKEHGAEVPFSAPRKIWPRTRRPCCR